MDLDPRGVYIVGAARTHIGALGGALSPLTAPQLGALAVSAALSRAGIDPRCVQELYMGCALPAGLGQAPATQVALQAGLGHVPATLVSKVCSSGLKAVALAAAAVRAGDADVAVGGGMESMSRAPYLVARAARAGRVGHGQLLDSEWGIGGGGGGVQIAAFRVPGRLPVMGLSVHRDSAQARLETAPLPSPIRRRSARRHPH